MKKYILSPNKKNKMPQTRCFTYRDKKQFSNIEYYLMILHDTDSNFLLTIQTQVLDATWDHLLSFRRLPPPPLIMERFCLKLIEGNPAASISSITSCQDTELHNISAKAWLNLLLKNADRLKKDTIVELACKVSNLIASSSRPQPVFQNILDSCTKFLPDIPLTT